MMKPSLLERFACGTPKIVPEPKLPRRGRLVLGGSGRADVDDGRPRVVRHRQDARGRGTRRPLCSTLARRSSGLARHIYIYVYIYIHIGDCGVIGAFEAPSKLRRRHFMSIETLSDAKNKHLHALGVTSPVSRPTEKHAAAPTSPICG